MQFNKDFDWLEELRNWEDSFLDSEAISEVLEGIPQELTPEEASKLANSSEEVW